MQWDASNAQAGFSTNPSTWLPVPPGLPARQRAKRARRSGLAAQLAPSPHRHAQQLRGAAQRAHGNARSRERGRAELCARLAGRQRLRGVVEHVGDARRRSGSIWRPRGWPATVSRRCCRAPATFPIAMAARRSACRRTPPGWPRCARRVRRCQAACAGHRPPAKFAARHEGAALATRQLSGWQTRHLHGGGCRARLRPARAARRGARLLCAGARRRRRHGSPFHECRRERFSRTRDRHAALPVSLHGARARRPDAPPLCHATVRAAVAAAQRAGPGSCRCSRAAAPSADA